jgi:hypothetical protein
VQFADQFSEMEVILTTFDAFLVNFCTRANYFGRKFAKNLFFKSVVLSLLPCIQLKITHWVSLSDVCDSYTNFKALYNRNKVLACEDRHVITHIIKPHSRMLVCHIGKEDNCKARVQQSKHLGHEMENVDLAW